MIYKCEGHQKEPLLNFLAVDPITNLFAIADIERYGFDSLDQDVWAYTDEKDEITGVLLRYRDIAIPVHSEEFSGFNTFLPLLQSLEEVTVISGEKKIIDQYKEYFPELEVEETIISVCQELVTPTQAIDFVKDLEKSDIPAYLTWQKSCFERESESEIVLSEMLDNQEIVVKVIKNEKGEILSAGRLSAEIPQAGMITRIGTIQSEEGKGYATMITASLTKLCLEKNKKACLFYANSAAGSIYHQLGFQDTTQQWSMLKPKKETPKKNLLQELIS